ncbi:hypothetical protein ONA00_03685 [Mycoplasmopsis cynos]|uniref:Vmc-like lipoprotein signal peptide domain-containing protein n=1 Tax=Mycoplasmopsis cynos TaxID=171284 RepID=UPI0024C58471|nr:hypothetical protein [Mycoplasmopsis cynos]WAM10474.1 hypothetical protein ONA00_03685 [Mycoplasmopsis cynos]
MSKYKKIFSGLGLLSISTLVGASVVACANKKPKTSDSSTEAIDQNNNQGNSTKPKDGENTPGDPTPEAPKTNPETSEEPKTETPKNPEMSKENPEQNDNTGKEMVQTVINKKKIKAKEVRMIQNKKINQLLNRNQNQNQKLLLKQNQWNYWKA